jgi:ABC-type Mn2+/Zn2+ transport system ATPase subunit
MLLSGTELIRMPALAGLDVDSRSTVLAILHELHATCNPHIIIGLRMQDAVPDWITHLTLVSNGHARTGAKTEVLRYKKQIQDASSTRGDAAVQNLKSRLSVGEPVVEMKNVSVTYGPRQVHTDPSLASLRHTAR